MRVAHIVHRCVPGEYEGGVERVALELADAQAQSGAQVEILTGPEGEAGYTQGGVPIRRFPLRAIPGLRASRELATWLGADRARYDVLHGHNTFHPLNIQTSRAARRLGLPAFFHAHGALDPTLLALGSRGGLKKRAYIAMFERPLLNRATAVFALSALERDQLREVGVVSPISVVPNGVPLAHARDHDDAGRALRTKLGVGTAASVVLFIGRIAPKKRLDLILAALAQARSHASDLVLLIAGHAIEDAAYEHEMRAAVDAHGLADAVHWLGHVDEQGKPAVIGASDIFIHASDSEGMAMAVLEAMAAGLPSIVTPGCYMGPAARAGAVLEVEQTVAALSDGLVRLARDRPAAKRLGDSGRDYVRAHHGWPAMAKAVLDTYERGLSARGPDSRAHRPLTKALKV